MLSSCVGRVLFAGLVALPVLAHGAERSLSPSDAPRLIVSGIDGHVAIEVGGSNSIEVTLKGSPADLDKVQVEDGRDALHVERTSGVQSTTQVGSVTVVTSGGGSSKVQIGGDTVADDGGEPVDLTARLPAGTGLELRGFTGTGEIGDLQAPLSVDCIGCRLEAGSVAEAALWVTGAGRVDVAAVADRLEASVTGDGSIDVQEGKVDTLIVAIQGAGAIAFDGRAEEARVELVGAGHVRLHEVGSIERSIVGAGRVEIASGG